MNKAAVSNIQQSGFTLIEVLVAFSITALALGILFQIYAKGTTAAILGNEYNQATAIAESKIASLGITEELETLAQSGTENGKYHWQIEVQDYATDTPAFVSPVSLKQVTLKVYWESRGHTRSISLNTLKPFIEP